MVFLDANVLVYSAGPALPMYPAATAAILDLQTSGEELWISRQTLREYLSVVTRGIALNRAICTTVFADAVRRWQARYHIAEDGPAVTAHLLTLFETVPVGGKQIHDANLVATMLAHGIGRLLTHNTEDFERFARWIEVVPLARWAT